MIPVALIVGGGIGGLTAAVALRQAGCVVQVLERTDEISTVGAGIMLQINAIRALDSIGVAEDITTVAVPIRSAKITSWSGRLIFKLESPDAPVFGYGIHRADLHGILLEHAGLENVRTGARVANYRLDGDRVVAVLKSGEAVTGDLLVGADGIHSTLRSSHLGDGPPRYAGYTCWRGLTAHAVPFEHGNAFEIWGAGKRFGGIYVDERLYWFAPVNATAGGMDEPGRVKGKLLELYEDWPQEVRATIASTHESAIIRNDIIDRPFTSDWGRGRMTLLGDAAHPMTPDVGQGACQAIEDAVVLGRCVSQFNDPTYALRRYEELRVPRTRRFVARSRLFGKVAQWESWTARCTRLVALRATPQFIVRRDLQRTFRFPG
ncbi:MAG: FAD-dependent monooxygenase [Gemmatimonadales bacterium]